MKKFYLFICLLLVSTNLFAKQRFRVFEGTICSAKQFESIVNNLISQGCTILETNMGIYHFSESPVWTLLYEDNGKKIDESIFKLESNN